MIYCIFFLFFSDAPAIMKKGKNSQVQKLKKIITKTVNANAEEQLRSIALNGKKSLSSKNLLK